MLDIEKIRKDFPILSREIYGRPLVYLDNGATTQKPLCVLDAMRDEYLNVNANVHRGVHWLSQQATDLHEAARETVRKFVNARSTSEIVFTRGTTESLNLVASSFVEGLHGGRRRGHREHDGAPFQHCPLATAAATQEHPPAGHSHERRRRTAPRRVRKVV